MVKFKVVLVYRNLVVYLEDLGFYLYFNKLEGFFICFIIFGIEFDIIKF